MNNSPSAMARRLPLVQAETSGVQIPSHGTPLESPCEEGKSRRRIKQVDQDYYCNYIIISAYRYHQCY